MLDRILLSSEATADCQSGNYAAAAESLNSTAPDQYNQTLRGSGWLTQNMPNDAEAILSGFAVAEQASNPGGPLEAYRYRIQETRKLLATSGIDWSAQLLQDLLPIVAQLCGWSESLLQRVRGIGVYKTLVTAEQVEQEWQAHLIQQEAQQQAARLSAKEMAIRQALIAIEPDTTLESLLLIISTNWPKE